MIITVTKQYGRADISTNTVLKYIQSTGTQYIDTGITPNQDTKVEIKVSLNSLYTDGNSNKGIIGARESGESKAYHLIAGGGGSGTEALFSGYGTTNTMITSNTLPLERNVDYTIIKDKNITSVNSTPVATADAQNFTAPYPLVIFAVRNGSTTPEFYGSMKLYYCKIYQGSELVRDFIPVLNPEGIPCLYDKVTQQYFYNSGEGAFRYKEAGTKVPLEYQEIEYIQSTGTQYIDTEYVNSGDYKPYKIEAEFKYTDISAGGFVFGTAQATTNRYPLVFGIDAGQNAWMFGHYGYEGASFRFGTPDNKNKHMVKYVFNEGLYLDNELVETEQASTQSNSGKSIGLFARIRGTTPSSYSHLSLYSCKFYEDNNLLVRDFVPCYRKSDGVVGLYDIVNDEFYTNSGTGVFTAGPEV